MTATDTKTEYISVADTAKLVRRALAAQFPGVKFSVRSKSYSGGASIDVSWKDGPTTKQVDRVVGRFSGSSFDGMTDLRSYHSSELDGRTVHFHADHVFTRREFSEPFLRSVAERTCKRWGVAVPEIRDTDWGATLITGLCGWVAGTNYTIADLVHQDAYRTFYFNGLRCMEKG